MKKMTPLDIQHQQFDKTFRGYDPEQVHAFVQDMVGYAEDVTKQILDLQDQVENQAKRMAELENNEMQIKDTMKTAQKMTEQIRENAHKESTLIIQQAEMQSEKMLKQAHDRLTEIITKINDMKKQKAEFHGQLKGLIETHFQLLRQEEDQLRQGEIEDVGLLPKVS